MKNTVFQQCCLQGMRQLAPESVDLILTDPPYFLQKTRKVRFQKKGTINKAFTFDQYASESAYLEFLQCVSQELFRVCKVGASGYLFCSETYVSYLIRLLEEAGFSCRKIFYWHKTNCFPGMSRSKMYASSIELAIHFGKGRISRWNPVNTTMHNHIDLPVYSGKHRFHPTQKPLKLMQHLMTISSQANDVVLDPFMGSGTTAVSALSLNRKFIGFELDPDYCLQMQHRFHRWLNEELYMPSNDPDELPTVLLPQAA